MTERQPIDVLNNLDHSHSNYVTDLARRVAEKRPDILTSFPLVAAFIDKSFGQASGWLAVGLARTEPGRRLINGTANFDGVTLLDKLSELGSFQAGLFARGLSDKELFGADNATRGMQLLIANSGTLAKKLLKVAEFQDVEAFVAALQTDNSGKALLSRIMQGNTITLPYDNPNSPVRDDDSLNAFMLAVYKDQQIANSLVTNDLVRARDLTDRTKFTASVIVLTLLEHKAYNQCLPDYLASLPASKIPDVINGVRHMMTYEQCAAVIPHLNAEQAGWAFDVINNNAPAYLANNRGEMSVALIERNQALHDKLAMNIQTPPPEVGEVESVFNQLLQQPPKFR